MQIKINGQTYTIKESIKNTRRAYAYQKKIISLFAESEKEEDETASVFKYITGNDQALDESISLLVDLIGEKTINADYFEENVSLEDLQAATEKAVNKLIGADKVDAGDQKAKKSAPTKP